MRGQFKITGYFYEVGNFSFRKYLNIKTLDCTLEKPDLMVVMMNPGSSAPYPDDTKKEYNTEVKTKPDITQDRIMKVMNDCGFSYTRVLNLSDLREVSSKCFYKKLKTLDSEKIAHSIFDETRSKDFDKLFNRKAPVIFAWGVNRKLKELSEKAFLKIDSKNYFGVKKSNENYAFYHPLIRKNSLNLNWTDEIIKQINTNKE
ncbi:DUF1643 domain-containing protein [Flavobacterium salilacus subsp. salilacus]|uniref:DUF1643 domain-containing protein n=1 Tax=Flavobacterium TaxID=237 RepID=UPI001074FE20|nr:MULTISPECIES: DUF1643 domain-containing protein [Flavobacterium]KAF2516894.1 DUF1643 domain-containing protein [Flavobacterium salilacus subsp. salilacus]MBE1615746.1 DUF1643 domain-containing protein [Flavobacterium sp. SaA2.13]